MGRTAAIILLLTSTAWAGQFSSFKHGGLTPLAQFHFNEGSGSATIDTTYKNPGTLTNATWVIGRFGNALRFTTSGAVLNMPGTGFSTLLSGSAAWTVTTWRRGATNAVSDGTMFFWGTDLANSRVAIKTEAGAITIKHNSSDFTYANVVPSIKDWDYIYATYLGGDPGLECAAIVVKGKQSKQCTTKTAVNTVFTLPFYSIGNTNAALNPDDECMCDLDDPRIFAGSDNFGLIWRGYWDGVRAGLQ